MAKSNAVKLVRPMAAHESIHLVHSSGQRTIQPTHASGMRLVPALPPQAPSRPRIYKRVFRLLHLLVPHMPVL